MNNADRRPGAYLLSCSPLLARWLKRKLGVCYSFSDSSDSKETDTLLPFISYVVIADGITVLDKNWQKFISVRRKCTPKANWLILVGDVHYEIAEDEKIIMAKGHKDVLNALVKLYYTLCK